MTLTKQQEYLHTVLKKAKEAIGQYGEDEMYRALEAILKLADRDGFVDKATDVSEAWKAGYRQCVLDVVEAVADETGDPL